MDLADKTQQLFHAIHARNTQHPGAARHLAYIRARLLAKTNQAIYEALYQEPEKYVPTVHIPRQLVDQFKHAARTVSRTFATPTELSGICSGTKNTTTWTPERFHVYYEQVCNRVRTKATSFGKIQTDTELKQKGLRNILTAHSHNVMSCFHSDTDEQTLFNNIRDSPDSISIYHNGATIHCPFACNIVFNEFVGGYSKEKPKHEPFVRAGILVPEYTLRGKRYREVINFNYTGTNKLLFFNQGRITKNDYERIKQEISERVTYHASIR